jgi:hypothetical protein
MEKYKNIINKYGNMGRMFKPDKYPQNYKLLTDYLYSILGEDYKQLPSIFEMLKFVVNDLRELPRCK